MHSAIEVHLASVPGPAWCERPVSLHGDRATIHLNDATGSSDGLRAIQMTARTLRGLGARAARLAGTGWDTERQWAFHQGFATMRQPDAMELAAGGDAAELGARREVLGWLRAMVNASPEEVDPGALADRATQMLEAMSPHVRVVQRVAGADLREAGWAGVWNVGRGSDRQPVLLELDYNPTGAADAPVAVALVGKGITFDSGGYSLKASESMRTMKCDMAGAATVVAALGLAIRRGLDRRVRLVLCCAENLVSGHAYKLGDVLTYRNGVTVEVANTDAEGRLVLADGLLLASASAPALIIDAATLTGAAVVAMGTEYNAVFGLDRAWRERALATAEAEHEPLWPLPVERWHRTMVPSACADTLNSRPVKGGGPGGASVAAGFLSRFVRDDGRRWLHIDLPAAYHDQAGPLWAEGATGLGVRTIAGLLAAT